MPAVRKDGPERPTGRWEGYLLALRVTKGARKMVIQQSPCVTFPRAHMTTAVKAVFCTNMCIGTAHISIPAHTNPHKYMHICIEKATIYSQKARVLASSKPCGNVLKTDRHTNRMQPRP